MGWWVGGLVRGQPGLPPSRRPFVRAAKSSKAASVKGPHLAVLIRLAARTLREEALRYAGLTPGAGGQSWLRPGPGI